MQIDGELVTYAVAGVVTIWGAAAGIAKYIGKRFTSLEAERVKANAALTAAHQASQARCEQENAKLSKEIVTVRDSLQAVLVTHVIEGARAMNSATESQRDGNMAQRELTAEVRRMCRRLEDVASFQGVPQKKDTPPIGSPITPANA